LYGGPYPFIQTGDIAAAHGRISTFRQTYSEAGLAQSKLWPKGTLCITIAANIAETALLTFPACFPDSVVGYTVDPAKADVRFVEYLFRAFREQVKRRAYGSVQENINLEVLRSLSFPVPPLPEQLRIADFLSILDDRIALLRETNATLEAIAQALFKSWFVDFDPVRAKQEGRAPEGMDEATAALFPDGFEESELGLVPKGWGVGSFGDLAGLVKGSVNPLESPGKEFEHYSLPSFDANQLPVRELGVSIKSNKTRIRPGVVLQSKLNPHIPRVWFPRDVGADAVCSTEFLPWLAKAPASPEVTYCLLKSPQFESVIRTLVTGTSNSHQRVKPDQVAASPIVIASAKAYGAFTGIVEPLLARAGENRKQCAQLAAVRDTLLPRLISGQIRLPEAEALVA